MHWIVLAAGIIAGGILRFLYNKKKNKALKYISFIVPFGFAIAYWILIFKTGYEPRFFSTTHTNVEYTGYTAKMLKWVMVLTTSCLITGVSWGFGALITFLGEKKHGT